MKKRLRVWWIPQVPGKPFTVDVERVKDGVMVMRVLGDYDAFQFENRIKPDYCSAGGLWQWSDDCDGEGNPGWEDWYDEETGEDDPEAYQEKTPTANLARPEDSGMGDNNRQ